MKQAFSYLLLPLLLAACTAHHYAKQKEDFSHYSLKETAVNRRGDSVVNIYRRQLSGEMSRIIGNSEKALTRDGSQSTLGNFVCDALVLAARNNFKNTTIDMALVNRGGLRTNLPKGDITVGNIFELMPFDNQMVLLKVSGKKLLSGLNMIAGKKHLFAGLQLVLKNDSVIESKMNGKPISENETYNIVTSDYIANGGDSFTFLSSPVETRTSDLKIRDAIIAYCEELSRNNKQLIPYTDERLVETR